MKITNVKLALLTSAIVVTGTMSCTKDNGNDSKPTISSFAPTTVFSGDSVTITGTNFTGATAVSFGGEDASWFEVANATTIKAVVGSGASGEVKVTTPMGSAKLGGFTLTPSAPAINVVDSIEIPFTSDSYTLYSFKDSTVIANTDSATSKWDFGIRFVNIITNSHASGPGNGGSITQQGVYANYTMAPASGYAYDTTKSTLGIDAGLTSGWYTYNPTTHAFSPKAGQFFVFRTADGHYVKMEIISVNYAGYNPPNPTPTTLIYKFRYSYQADGSRNF
ncbi:hypothetical protein EFY79_12825 [Hanamia caeni]|jgi:hypothetical protein|uniref:IPT/TIG domain-containing protein n=1 Tax=Hanamia caeni TaxID=2294116 RepID=A0A3M9NDJ2_9BACT|nr:IPT/TIG domain-containing protein [Hanamia caeni]RNI35826.1 hypothetical protein EFY79_12825 [Hanamia caeni]